jgi:hypothetical protein
MLYTSFRNDQWFSVAKNIGSRYNSRGHARKGMSFSEGGGHHETIFRWDATFGWSFGTHRVLTE